MSHKHVVLITAGLLLLSPAAVAESISNSSASNFGNEPFESKVFVIGGATNGLTPDSESAIADQNESTLTDLQITNTDLGVQFTPGQYHGNKGPASEEQGIQLLFSAQ